MEAAGCCRQGLNSKAAAVMQPSRGSPNLSYLHRKSCRSIAAQAPLNGGQQHDLCALLMLPEGLLNTGWQRG